MSRWHFDVLNFICYLLDQSVSFFNVCSMSWSDNIVSRAENVVVKYSLLVEI